MSTSYSGEAVDITLGAGSLLVAACVICWKRWDELRSLMIRGSRERNRQHHENDDLERGMPLRQASIGHRIEMAENMSSSTLNSLTASRGSSLLPSTLALPSTPFKRSSRYMESTHPSSTNNISRWSPTKSGSTNKAYVKNTRSSTSTQLSTPEDSSALHDEHDSSEISSISQNR